MKMKARKHLARQVRLLRTNRGWSQEVLAELSGLNRSYIGAVERAEHNIGLDNIERISSALETSLSALLNNTADQPPQPAQSNAAPALNRQPVIIHRKIFLKLLQQCAQSHRELVLVYLERCGVTLRD
ncbi:hypothetical protein MNBD_GAMMA13-597 [hydrothermal vent metagenome]|uniref:HTH cro/C1-type domain-containing protein n=1 Tax=hydrothermal vent metagenome TaxID=652676 RepID=A0A3B0YUB0_9ZZZZ